jgi:hypothetical protein
MIVDSASWLESGAVEKWLNEMNDRENKEALHTTRILLCDEND